MDTDIRIVAVLMFFLGVLVTFSLVRTFGDADALPQDYYTYEGNGIFIWNKQVFNVLKDCSWTTYSYETCQRSSIILLQNERIIDLLEEVKNATRG